MLERRAILCYPLINFMAEMLRSRLHRKFILIGAIVLPAGALIASFVGQHVYQTLGPLWAVLFGLVTLTATCLLALCALLQRLVVSPVRRIREADRNALEGNMEGLLVDEAIPDNEIGDLMRSRNRLLSRIQRRHRGLYEIAPVGLYELDSQGHIIAINPMLLNWLERTREEVVGMPLNELLTDEAKWKFGQLIESCRRGEIVKDLNIDLARRDGNPFHARVNAVSTFDDAGDYICCQGVIMDMSREKFLEKQLLHAQKMEAIGLLAGGIAHDFNNILTVMLGNIELALGKLEDPEWVRRQLDIALEAGERATALIRQLLAFSRQQALALQPVNMAAMLLNLSKMLRRLISEDIDLKLDIAPDLANVYADPAALEQVFINLAVNARDAMPNGGLLTVSTSDMEITEEFCRSHPDARPGHYVLVSVADTGVGMDEATLERIFEPFFTTKEAGKGTGLGLSVTYGIVQHHGGFIVVESRPDEGSRFDVYLPLYRAPAEPGEDQSPGDEIPGGSETILLADDQENVREVLRAQLEDLGYTVLTAADGREALEIFVRNQDKIDIVILDTIMPRVNGPRAYELMRLLSPVPCLFLTGYSEEMSRRYFDRTAHVPLLHKPARLRELARKVREILDARSKKQRG